MVENFKPEKIQLTPIGASTRGDTVVIQFADGVRAFFVPYSHGFGYSIEGLQRFGIEDDHGKLVVQYNARLHRCGPQPDEHKIVVLDDGWTIARVVAYWEAARKYCTKLFYGEGGRQPDREPNAKWGYHWGVTRNGWSDLESLRRKIENDLSAK